MLASKLFYRTRRDVSAEADTVSHRLLLQAGFIQQVAAGIFSYLPLGWRSIQKIRRILVEEMDAIGAQEINMPVVQPMSLWRQSGRADTFIPPLPVFQDRRGRPMTLAPTHEETATLMARAVISSYRDMPRMTYHIQTKYRDEPRPRAGLLRVREFEMKDAYSFDIDEAGLDVSFELMAAAYHKIFARCGTPAIMAEADSGPIGGKSSREFVLPAASGDDVLLKCGTCDYAANIERADFRKEAAPDELPAPMEMFDTPGVKTIAELAQAENVPPAKTAKVVFFHTDAGIVIAAIRGDYAVNETKLRNIAQRPIRIAEPDEVAQAGLIAGSASPIGMSDNAAIHMIVADDSLQNAVNLLAGANVAEKHFRNVNFPRDFAADTVGDIAEAAPGYGCPRCDGRLEAQKGIEVGHIFKLGDGYARTMELAFTDEDGAQKYPLMGSYGIGLGRLLAAVIEANHDDRGMLLPKAVAPYAVSVISLAPQGSTEYAACERIYDRLNELGIETLFDDRDEPPGVKFADTDLIGIPARVLVSSRSVKNGGAEIKSRRESNGRIIPFEEVPQAVAELLSGLP